MLLVMTIIPFPTLRFSHADSWKNQKISFCKEYFEIASTVLFKRHTLKSVYYIVPVEPFPTIFEIII